MIPNLNQTNVTATKRGTYPSKTWAIDRERKRIVRQCDGFDSVYQAVQKVLLTERYSEQIYSTSYGIELRSMIGKPTSYIKAALSQAIKDALMQDDRITSVKLSDVLIQNDSITVTVDVLTNIGEIRVRTDLT